MEDKIRVLPVDDNPAILKLIGDFLSQKNWWAAPATGNRP